MATQSIEIEAVDGETSCSMELFAVGSDTVVDTAAIAAGETNRPDTYIGAFTDVAAGTYKVLLFDSSDNVLSSGYVVLTLSTATFYARESILLAQYGTGLTPPTAAQNRAEMDSNSTQLAAIVADANEMQTDLADGGRLDLIFDAIQTAVVTTIPALLPSALVGGKIDASVGAYQSGQVPVRIGVECLHTNTGTGDDAGEAEEVTITEV